jgi:hypothetical protein
MIALNVLCFKIMTNHRVKAKSIKVSLLKSTATSVLALSAMTGVLIASGTSVSAQVAPPFGSSVAGQNKNIFYFTPWGIQLDSDNTPNDLHVPDTDLSANPQVINHNIYDIRIGPETLLDFDLFLYTTAPQYTAANTLHSFSFSTLIDTDEYNLNNTLLGSDIDSCTYTPTPGDPAGLLNCHFKANVTVTPGAFANPIKLATFKGVTVFPGLEPHDGISDFKITLNQLTVGSSVNVPGVANQFQDVEVQHVPGPLPILGAAAAFRFCRKARKLSARNKTLSMG